MRGVVYVDILVLVNAVIAMFLLRCTARLTGSPLGLFAWPPPGWRLVLPL